MSPEEKEKINKFLKQMGGEHTVDELEAARKRAVRTLEEWCAQDWEQRKALPQEVKDMQMVCRYTLFATIAGIAPLLQALNGLDMAVEAAYNLGKANKDKK
jgi:hypothetical protein